MSEIIIFSFYLMEQNGIKQFVALLLSCWPLTIEFNQNLKDLVWSFKQSSKDKSKNNNTRQNKAKQD